MTIHRRLLVRALMIPASVAFAFMVNCDAFNFATQGPDQGGIEIRCAVMEDDFDGYIVAPSPDLCLVEDVDDDDITPIPEISPAIDANGNSLGFATDEPHCTSITVDTCVPRWIMVSGSKYEIRDKLNTGGYQISQLGDAAKQKINDNCILAAGYGQALYSSSIDPLNTAALDMAARQYWAYQTAAKRVIVLMPGQFLNPNTETPDPDVGTRPIQTENGCETGYNPSDPKFPYFERQVFANKNARHLAGLAQLADARSKVLVTLTDDNGPHATTAVVKGEILGDKEQCQTASDGTESCQLRLMSATLTLSAFSLAGKNVDVTSLRNSGVAIGQTAGSATTIPPAAMNLTGEFKIDGNVGIAAFKNTSAISGTWDPENNNAQISLNLSADTPSGTITISGSVGGVFLNRTPLPVPGPDQTVECAAPTGTTATLDGSQSRDLDKPSIGYEWRGPDIPPDDFSFGSLNTLRFATPFARTAIAQTPALPLGAHTFDLLVRDTWAWTDHEPTTVTVVDTKPPTISVASTSPNCLWPPDHRLVQFSLGDQLQVTATDQCTGDVSASLKIVGIHSNEPANGLGDGNTAPDFVVGNRALCLRAERNGVDDDRIYTITLQADDGHGNTVTSDVQITVPHDQGGGNCRSTPLPDCTLTVGATPQDPVADSTVAPSAPPPSGHAGCSVAATVPRSSAFGALFILLLLGGLMRRRVLALLAMLAFTMTACSSSRSATGTAALTVTEDSRQPVSVTAAPYLAFSGGTVLARVAGDATVFISFPKTLADASNTLSVGVGANNAVVWGQTANDSGPLTATTGSLQILSADYSTTGKISMQLTAQKAADLTGPSISISGAVQGAWSSQ